MTPSRHGSRSRRRISIAVVLSVAVHATALIVFRSGPPSLPPQPVIALQFVPAAAGGAEAAVIGPPASTNSLVEAEQQARDASVPKLAPARREQAPRQLETAAAVAATVVTAAPERKATPSPSAHRTAMPAASSSLPTAASIPAPRSGHNNATPVAQVATVQLQLMAWLERHKRYPPAARRRGIEGAALVRFVIAASGELLQRELLQSSGSRHLDRAALQLLRDAAPYPPLPSSLSIDTLEVELPVEYRLLSDGRRT